MNWPKRKEMSAEFMQHYDDILLCACLLLWRWFNNNSFQLASGARINIFELLKNVKKMINKYLKCSSKWPKHTARYTASVFWELYIDLFMHIMYIHLTLG